MVPFKRAWHPDILVLTRCSIQVRLLMKQDPEEQIPDYDDIFRWGAYLDLGVFDLIDI